ncbi:MAG: hypothetical protein AUI17_06490 [Acidobacteriales bacterium 13_2_20CM_2_55_5]|nr:MAG: hypothetical protein AUI17_06490 [Acidobacteriales bacterium 13_2_20CM_2_55_5]
MKARKSAEIPLRVFVRRQKCAELLTPLPIARHGTALICGFGEARFAEPLQLLTYQCRSKIRLSMRLRHRK